MHHCEDSDRGPFRGLHAAFLAVPVAGAVRRPARRGARAAALPRARARRRAAVGHRARDRARPRRLRVGSHLGRPGPLRRRRLQGLAARSGGSGLAAGQPDPGPVRGWPQPHLGGQRRWRRERDGHQPRRFPPLPHQQPSGDGERRRLHHHRPGRRGLAGHVRWRPVPDRRRGPDQAHACRRRGDRRDPGPRGHGHLDGRAGPDHPGGHAQRTGPLRRQGQPRAAPAAARQRAVPAGDRAVARR